MDLFLGASPCFLYSFRVVFVLLVSPDGFLVLKYIVCVDLSDLGVVSLSECMCTHTWWVWGIQIFTVSEAIFSEYTQCVCFILFWLHRLYVF